MEDRKKIYLGTNTKMYKTIKDTTSFLLRLNELTEDIPEDVLTLFVIPSYTALYAAKEVMKDKRILIGAQNMGWEDQGQFTGEISPLMLKEIGIDMVMIGHSERRHVFRETDFEEEKKVAKALEHGFIPLLCIGETLQEKEYGLSEEVLRTQLKVGLHSVSKGDCSRLMVAYEPVWSIGVNGIPATKEYAQQMHGVIKDTLRELFDEAADGIPVLYGGSVNPQNCEELFAQKDIDGLFIGRSAWDADNFNQIIRMVLKIQKEV
ncbi:MAG: triose-phosphate isomerase [Erysipelotrichaceae bacterium]|nr:triose-phosphate isomerase [Erysipelotrichaceae bacterium]